jgi:hypothetical protein
LFSIILQTRIIHILTGKRDLKSLVHSLTRDCVDPDMGVDEVKFGYLIGDKRSVRVEFR